MRKSIVLFFSSALMLSIILTACQLTSSTDADYEEMVVSTMVAMASTQTALAETQETEKVTEVPTEEITEEETSAPIEVTHNITPGEPGWINKWFYDTDASQTGGGYVNMGDDFVANLFERPFTEGDMIYRPDVDINKTEMSEDGTFFYVTIYLNGTHPDGGLKAAYGVEIDTNWDGRGDLLVIADRPTSTEWDIIGVSVHKDPNSDVGGSKIMRPDTGYNGDGYEQVVFSMDVLDDPDAAWVRITTGSSPSVTIAFKKSLVNNKSELVWGVWAADSLLDPALIDLHDNFTEADAGSPYSSHSNYPLAAVNLVDNTCRETYKFEAEESIPGLCYKPEPKPTVTPTYTAEPQLGSITGVAFDDLNNDGDRDSGEPITVYSVTITLHSGSCSARAMSTTSSKTFSFTDLAAGTYCVKINPSGSMTTPSSYTVDVPAGGSKYVEFGYYVVQ